MNKARIVFALAFLGAAIARGDDPPSGTKPRFPGPTGSGFLLPNGWHLTPAGTHLVTTDLPLNIIPLKDCRHVLLATSGYNQHDLMLVDVSGETPKVVDKASNRQSWFGLAVDKAEGRVWLSGGGQRTVYPYTLKDGKFGRVAADADASKDARGNAGAAEPDTMKSFKSGLALDETKGILYSLDINGGFISAYPLAGGKTRTGSLGGRPYDVKVGPGGNLLYVSDWAGRRVLAVDPVGLRVVQKIPVAEHPNQMVLHKDGRLFVACASSNCVSVIDTKRGIVTETIFTSLFPKAPEGSTPDALALAPDGQSLYVANADNNCVAVIDVEAANKSQVKGFIPTGWYPTAVAVSTDGKNLLIGVGKGLQSKPNPRSAPQGGKDDGKAAGRRLMPYPYIGTTMTGALSVVPVPDETKLKEYTAQVYRNCPYSDALLTAIPYTRKTAIPAKVGEPSPIKYVVYIIKENRTYDQVLGDMPRGNGDKSLVMFGEELTP
ncbi:MAG TPA: beta-propeller fold lactonase family protein, partial [Fimbriiglobus sp.]